MSEREVRVRIAPSPTGDPHVGTAYQALYNYVFAKSHGGKFVLRIEDTDQARSSKQSEEMILESLQWLGLQWDEGPDVGGPHAPYRQSERTELYRKYAMQLVEAGHAYRDFRSPEEIDALKAKRREENLPAGWDPEGQALPVEEAERRAAAGEAHVIRMKVPTEGECVIKDVLHGEIRKDWASIDNQIILKSDGFPTYHLANVVDDHLMGISHVIRGEEWINSVPKHLLLYEQLGWEPPVFCHLPLLRNADKTKSKLSKRKNPTSINYYRRAGFLPQALLNFLGMLGWTMPGGEEKFTVAEMLEHFKLGDVSKGGPVFDVAKLRWLNGRYIREDYDAAALTELLFSWSLGAETVEKIAPLAQPRLETLSDWAYLTAFFFADAVPVDPELLKLKGKSPEELLEIMQLAIWRLEQQRDFSSDALEALFADLAERFELKLRELTRPFYVALTGRTAATPLYQSMEILGSDLVRMRLRRALDALGGVSGKKSKAFDKRYRELWGPRD